MNEVNVDFLGKDSGQGAVAASIMANGRMEPGALRPFIGTDNKCYITVFKGGDATKKENYQTMPIQVNATLRRDEWKQLDDAVLPISRSRLIGVQDLIDNGLVYNLGNAMGTTVLEYHDMSDAMFADMTMDGVTRSKGDRVEFTSKYLPIPIIHSDYEINARVLAMGRNMGNPIDVSSAEAAARKVAEKLEALLFTDTAYSFGGGSIYSYVNFPHRNLATLSFGWDASGATGATIIADVVAMKAVNLAAYHYGPFMLYIPTAYETVLDGDYDTTRGNTIRERILQIEGIKGIKTINDLATDNVLLVQMTSDVVRLVRGMGIQNIQWQTEGTFINKFKVLTIQVPQIRADQAGKSGIVHASI